MRVSTIVLCSMAIAAALVPARPEGPAASWEGLTGLFTMPTAQTLRHGQIALVYAEARFANERDGRKSLDTWFTASAATAVFPRLEIAVTSRHEIYKFGPGSTSGFTNQLNDTFVLGHVKYVVVRPDTRKVGLAIGALDITDTASKLEGINVGRGRRIFLVSSYQWAHLSAFYTDGHLGASAGAQWSVTDNIDLVSEVVTNPVFVKAIPSSNSGVNFNIGARIHPREVPNLRFDVAGIGDGKFDFGFSLSYNFRL